MDRRLGRMFVIFRPFDRLHRFHERSREHLIDVTDRDDLEPLFDA
jgi:hypothetical protein